MCIKTDWDFHLWAGTETMLQMRPRFHIRSGRERVEIANRKFSLLPKSQGRCSARRARESERVRERERERGRLESVLPFLRGKVNRCQRLPHANSLLKRLESKKRKDGREGRKKGGRERRHRFLASSFAKFGPSPSSKLIYPLARG